MILYLTYNDQPSGVYWSQVCDVIRYLQRDLRTPVRLLALVSGRGYLESRRQIRQRLPDAIVLPMVPRAKNWKLNSTIVVGLCRLLRPKGIIARGVFATWMARRARDRGLCSRVCFDARGAYAAEWEEYRIIDDDALIAQVGPLEHDAIQRSDFRIAVARALVQHWRDRYGYGGDQHVVIPCLLGEEAGGSSDPLRVRSGLGYDDGDVVLVYAGSTAGWQSFKMLEELLAGTLDAQRSVKVLFLSRPDTHTTALAARYPGRVHVKWADAADVPVILRACDHGLLVRESTVTNRVASPTKFAEYLSAGLPVIISPDLGDQTAEVEREKLGIVHRPGTVLPELMRPSPTDRGRLEAYACTHLTKQACVREYRLVLDALMA